MRLNPRFLLSCCIIRLRGLSWNQEKKKSPSCPVIPPSVCSPVMRNRWFGESLWAQTLIHDLKYIYKKRFLEALERILNVDSVQAQKQHFMQPAANCSWEHPNRVFSFYTASFAVVLIRRHNIHWLETELRTVAHKTWARVRDAKRNHYPSLMSTNVYFKPQRVWYFYWFSKVLLSLTLYCVIMVARLVKPWPQSMQQ